MIEDYLLIDVDDRSNITLIRISDDRNPDAIDIPDVQSTQIKVNESKVYKSKTCENKACENKNKIYNTIFDTYNNQNIIIHRNRFCTYKMTLAKLLIQDNGYTDWLDDGQKWINYMDFMNRTEERPEEDQKSKIRTKFHLAKSRGDKYTADELEELILNNQRIKMKEGLSYDKSTTLPITDGVVI